MRLLLDQNLSFKLVARLTVHFGEVHHVRMLGLTASEDAEIWRYSCDYGYSIVTFDRDFSDRAIIFGAPPKVIWLKLLNPSTQDVFDTLLRNREIILEFINESYASCLELG